MKFLIERDIFDAIPTLCVGVVVAREIDNREKKPEIDMFLDEAIKQAEMRFCGKKVKEEKEIAPYRNAFQQLGINPNKYLCSIEALITRISKGKGMPHINPLVDLNNAVSLMNTLPMGTHDLSQSNEDIMIRYSRSNDRFLPFGALQEELPDANEVVYAVGNQIRTRRWTWRQSEYGKIDENSRNVFFPIDGFIGVNDEKVQHATKQLEEMLRHHFSCQITTGFVHGGQPEMTLF